MKLMPIVYVSNIGRAADFYTALGFQGSVTDRAGVSAELSMGGAILGLHAANPLPPAGHGRVGLALVSEEVLEILDHVLMRRASC